MMFGTLGAVMTPGAALGQAFDFKPNRRYPDPSVQILDPSFTRYRIFSFRWDDATNTAGVFRYPSNFSNGLARDDPQNNSVALMLDNLAGPNGLCFSPDEKKLCVVEGRATPNRLVWVYDVLDGGKKLSERKVAIDAGGPGALDGIKCDEDGNLCFGGPKGDRLFMTGSHSLYALYVETRGAVC